MLQIGIDIFHVISVVMYKLTAVPSRSHDVLGVSKCFENKTMMCRALFPIFQECRFVNEAIHPAADLGPLSTRLAPAISRRTTSAGFTIFTVASKKADYEAPQGIKLCCLSSGKQWGPKQARVARN
jgi:hypothetical protein